MPTTTNKGFVEPVIGAAGWGVTLNDLFNAIDSTFGSTTIVPPLSNLNVTLTTAQYQPPIIKLSGTLNANVIVSLPAGIGGAWYVYNGCTGSFTVTFASNGANGQVLKQGYWSALICDGTSVNFQSTLPGAASGSNTQIQYNNGGVLGSSSDLTYATTTATFTATVPIGSNVMTVSAVASGTIALGMTLTVSSGGGFSGAVTITALGTGTGGLGTYTVSQNATGSIANITSASITTLSAPNLSGNFLGTARFATYAGSTSNAVGYLKIPQTTSTSVSSATDGYHVYTASDVTVTGSSFSVGDCFVIVNSGSTATSIIPGASTTLRLAASTSSVAQNVTVTFTNGSANITGSNLPAIGTAVKFTTTGSLPTNFAAGTTYYVVSNTSNTTITVSATSGGAAITAGSAGSGTQTMTNNRTIAGYGQAVVLCVASNTFFVSGQGVS
jgi:hypothetical protein